ncbi:AbiH family protein, partial [Paenibacillus barengoltzii]
MTLDYSNNNLTRQLIVMGNGFDLQCGMPTRYQDFFDYRFGISLQYKINKYLESNSDARTEFYETLFQKLYSYLTITVGPKQIIRTSSSINTTEEKLKIISKTQSLTKKYLLQIKNQITNNIKDPQLQKNFFIEWETISSITYSKWDTIFLLANCFLSEDSIIQWNDVENIILKIVSIILLDNKKVSSDDLTSDLTFKSNSSKRYFIFGVRNCFNESKNKVAIAMLNQLRIFEENFADYINKIRAESPNRYYRPSFELLTNLMHVQKENILDVLSFNYSLDKGCLDGF